MRAWAVLLIAIADVPSVICFGILLAPKFTRPRLVSDVATIRQHGVPASLCATPRSVSGGVVSAESDFRRRCSCHIVFAGSGGESERGIEEGLGGNEGKRNEKLAKKEGGVLKAVSGLRDLLGIVLLCSYITAMLSLDFYWAAINPQNFGFVVSMLTISLGINKWRFNSNNAYVDQPPPELLPQSWAQRYAIFMTIISILIPWALLLSGNNFYRRLMVMAPHLYLVMAQELLERLGRSLGWALPVRLLNSVAFNTYRLLSLRDWFVTVFTSQSVSYATRFTMEDKVLVAANVVLWTLNLVVVLLAGAVPRVLHPKYRPELSGEELDAEAEHLRLLAARKSAPPTTRNDTCP